MDNAIWILIVALLAAVIVWQASKLKQYQALERLLDSQDGRKNESAGPHSRVSGASAINTPTVGSDSDATAGRPISSVTEPRPPPEANIEDAKKAQGVMARCHYAEFYVEQLDDDHEREQFRSIVSSCIDMAAEIDDVFYRATALETLVLLLDSAGWTQLRDETLGRVEDDLVRERLVRALNESEEGLEKAP